MDSVTQIVLGACVGEAVLGHKVGRKAMAWGAFLGTLPDLDVLVRYSTVVDDFTMHRSFSHSLWVLTFISPLLAWLISRLHPSTREHIRGWLWLVFACLVTHVLLDSLTIYGTQIGWPFNTTPVGVGSIFIIDPLYTLPLIAGLVYVFWHRHRPGFDSRKPMLLVLTISSAYLLWSLGVQAYLSRQLDQHLQITGVNNSQTLLTPAPFNTILWRFIVRVQGGYYEGYISLLDQDKPPSMQFYSSEDKYLEQLKSIPSAQQLMSFTHGFFSVQRAQDKIIISDLRMGVEPAFVFSFRIAKAEGPLLTAITPERVNTRVYSDKRFRWTLERISNPWLPLPAGNFGLRLQ
jgi:inner membrane protein